MQYISNVPKDIFSDKEVSKTIPKKITENIRNLMITMRPVYMVKTNKRIHQMIQLDLTKYEQYVSDLCVTYARKKEINKQSMFRGSFQTINPNEFLELLEQHIY